MGYFHLLFVRSTARLHCAVTAGPGTIPRYNGFWKISKGSGSPWLPKRIWREVVHNSGAGAYLEKKLRKSCVYDGLQPPRL